MLTAAEILALNKAGKIDLKKFVSKHSFFSENRASAFRIHELNALYFLSIQNPIDLSRFFKISFKDLEALLNNPTYNTFSIQKKKSGNRIINEPDKVLKIKQKHLNYYLQAYYLWIKPQEVHGFVIHPHDLGTYCNIVENAKIHVDKKYVLNIDLKDFFSSISAWQIKGMFTSAYFNFSEQIATALTLLTTFEGKLPTGAPTSPVISNFVCLDLDKELIQFCKENNLRYSRYADDLTFSSDAPITTKIIAEITNQIEKYNFEVNQKKVRLKTAGRKQTVTGLTVNKKVNIDRKLLKKVRAMLHDLTTNGLENATKKHFKVISAEQKFLDQFINRLSGYINFIGQVRGKNDTLYLRFKMSFNTALELTK